MDLTGSTLHGYYLETALGRGAMGEAYLARQTPESEPVVIKLLVADYQGDSQFLARFQREMRLLRELAHPQIVPLYDWGVLEDGRPFLVMKYIQGRNLQQVMQTQRLTPRQIAAFLEPITHTLHFIHWRGVLHRDIKPSNILLDETEGQHVYLADFGLSKQLGVDLTVTESQTSIGTPEYMAPEIALGRSADHRSDLYSLAVMLYEMHLGLLPFESGGSLMKLALAHATTPPLAPSMYRADFPLPLEAVILKGLAKDPEERYPSAAAMGAAFQAALAHLTETEQTHDYWLR